MSLVNWWCSKDQAVVCVDTRVSGLAGGPTSASKLAYVPHANLILAGRGQVALIQVAGLLLQAGTESFDAAERDLPQILDTARKTLAAHSEERGELEGQDHRCHVVAIGYSEVHRSFRAAFSTRESLDQGFAPPTNQHACYSPWDERFGAPPVAQASTHELMMIVAKHQLSVAAGTELEAQIGGALVIVSMTRDGAQFKLLGVE